MIAPLFRVALCAACFLSLGAGYRTTNFLVNAPTQEMARTIGDEAERYRAELAVQWLGHELPPWHQPCPITAEVGPNMGAGGATSFMFEQGRPFGWRMSIQGPWDRLIDSVLPHEVTHTLFATHFGRPLPRWADEGACTTVEHESEKRKQHHLLTQFLTTNRGIAFNRMFAMKEYPADILPLYAQGFSLTRFLIQHGGQRKFIQYVGEGMRSNDWNGATASQYGFRDLSELQVTWLEWVRRGCPDLNPTPQLAANNGPVDNQVATAGWQTPLPQTPLPQTPLPQISVPRSATDVPSPPQESLAHESPFRQSVAAAARQSLDDPRGATQIVRGQGGGGSQSAHTSDNSWYAQQAAQRGRDGGQSHPHAAPLSGGQSWSRPQAAQQTPERVLQWSEGPSPNNSWAPGSTVPPTQGTFWR